MPTVAWADIMEKERAEKSVGKLRAKLEEMGKAGLETKYPKVVKLAREYLQDAEHFFGKGDYFSSFGASDYAYGLLDALLIIEGKK